MYNQSFTSSGFQGSSMGSGMQGSGSRSAQPSQKYKPVGFVQSVYGQNQMQSGSAARTSYRPSASTISGAQPQTSSATRFMPTGTPVHSQTASYGMGQSHATTQTHTFGSMQTQQTHQPHMPQQPQMFQQPQQTQMFQQPQQWQQSQQQQQAQQHAYQSPQSFHLPNYRGSQQGQTTSGFTTFGR